MTDVELKRWDSSEKSPTYFARNEVLIDTPHSGITSFELYDHESNLLKRLLQRDHYIISKARQMGISTTLLVYCLWKMLFNTNFKIVLLSSNTAMNHNLSRRIQDIYYRLDDIFKHGTNEIDRASKKAFYLKSGSGISFVPTGTDPHSYGVGKSQHIDLLIGEEIAYINKFEIWADTFAQLLKPDSSVVFASTPSRDSSWFDSTFMRALRGQNKFVPMQLDWTLHPDRDTQWRREQDKMMGAIDAKINLEGSVKEIKKPT